MNRFRCGQGGDCKFSLREGDTTTLGTAAIRPATQPPWKLQSGPRVLRTLGTMLKDWVDFGWISYLVTRGWVSGALATLWHALFENWRARQYPLVIQMLRGVQLVPQKQKQQRKPKVKPQFHVFCFPASLRLRRQQRTAEATCRCGLPRLISSLPSTDRAMILLKETVGPARWSDSGYFKTNHDHQILFH